MKKQNLNFAKALYVKGQLPHYYIKVVNNLSNNPIFKNTTNSVEDLDLFFVKDLPRYLTVLRTKLPEYLKSISVKTYPGFLIDFKGIETMHDYLKERFGRTSRYKLKREKKKLEHCFDISYQMFYGEITKDDYNFIFDEFFRILEIRSLEKNIRDNKKLRFKNDYYKRVYPMILNRKASFFVIYSGTQPIDICLNFHANKTLFQDIRTFDIAYSKFNPGYLDLMKQIEWCIQKNIDSITFSKADFYWKRRWCNTIYNYDHEIIFKKRSLKARFTAYKIYYKTKMIQYLREKGVIEKYHELRNNRKKRLKAKLLNTNYKINILEKMSINNASDHLKIDYHTKEFDVLRRYIYEFLYATNEREKDIAVYKLNKNSNDYIVYGKATTGTLTM